jgi:diguanylate cyclase (GGDEF)-like protein
MNRLVQLFARQQANFEIIMACMTQGVALYDSDMKLILCNRRYMELHNLPEELAVPGLSFLEMLHYRIRRGSYPDIPPDQYISEMMKAVKSDVQQKTVQHLRNGSTISFGCIPLDGGGWLSTHEDVSEIYTLQREVQQMAFHDQLTGLPNRRMLIKSLEDANNNCRANKGFSLLFLDLDGFKPVNDQYGHSMGDRLLCQVAERLKSCIRGDDLISRLGGDEFAVVNKSANRAGDAEILARRILDALEMPFDIGMGRIGVSSSIGIVFTDHKLSDVELLLTEADKAMYVAKREGGMRFHVATPDIKARPAA